MNMINIHEAKTQLSRWLKKVEQGETILLCRRNIPVAEIRPIPRKASKPRAVGLAAGSFTVPPEFFDPLPEDIVRAFEGRSMDDSDTP